MKVLIADDDPTTLIALTSLVRAAGHEVDAVPTAAEAMALLEKRPYDAAAIDLLLGGADGAAVARAAAASVPRVVIESARDMADIREAASGLPADRVITLQKPYEASELLAALEKKGVP